MKCPNCGCTLVKVDDHLIHVRFQDNADGTPNWQFIETLPVGYVLDGEHDRRFDPGHGPSQKKPIDY